jgi:hypothetical protein
MTCPDSERDKADVDLTYEPLEEVYGTIECEEWEIERRVSKGIRNGSLPLDSQYTEA